MRVAAFFVTEFATETVRWIVLVMRAHKAPMTHNELDRPMLNRRHFLHIDAGRFVIVALSPADQAARGGPVLSELLRL